MNAAQLVDKLLEADDLSGWLDRTIDNFYPMHVLKCPCCEADLRQSRSVYRQYRFPWRGGFTGTEGHYDQASGQYVLEHPQDLDLAQAYTYSDCDTCANCSQTLDRPYRRGLEMEAAEMNPLDDPTKFLDNLPPARCMAAKRLLDAGFHIDDDWTRSDDDEEDDSFVTSANRKSAEDHAYYKHVSTEAYDWRGLLVTVERKHFDEFRKTHSVQIYDPERRFIMTYADNVTFMDASAKAIELVGLLERNEVEIIGNKMFPKER